MAPENTVSGQSSKKVSQVSYLFIQLTQWHLFQIAELLETDKNLLGSHIGPVKLLKSNKPVSMATIFVTTVYNSKVMFFTKQLLNTSSVL